MVKNEIKKVLVLVDQQLPPQQASDDPVNSRSSLHASEKHALLQGSKIYWVEEGVSFFFFFAFFSSFV